ncbi:hypothetical protein M747DRAFT_56511 [Aspergillus niger ATCC 13496]|uniref:Uncharacterized protein n=1 Tax=Aspergillus niger ATCC 13496 TaxID=1353008 RepID=A0A370CG87_ASPNG|nr:hypothetical protein M747DRAFT_56511 [Aspergillus niger ATCC 13496]
MPFSFSPFSSLLLVVSIVLFIVFSCVAGLGCSILRHLMWLLHSLPFLLDRRSLTWSCRPSSTFFFFIFSPAFSHSGRLHTVAQRLHGVLFGLLYILLFFCFHNCSLVSSCRSWLLLYDTRPAKYDRLFPQRSISRWPCSE